MSAADCQLKVWRLSGGLIFELLTVEELGEPWRHFEVNITSSEEYQVRLSRKNPLLRESVSFLKKVTANASAGIYPLLLTDCV